MHRAAIVALTMAVFTAPPAFAVDFSKASCEHPEMKKAMQADLIKAQAPDGKTLRSRGVDVVSIVETSDRFRSRDKLICGFTAELNGFGSTQTLRGQVTFRQFGSGKLTGSWTFGY